MVMVFIFFFGATFNASPYAYAAEVLPTKIRASGMVIALFAANAVTVMFTQTAPIGLEAIKWKFGFIFIGCNLAFFPVIYIFFPEVYHFRLPMQCKLRIWLTFSQTKGLTLEEVNRAFGDKVEMELSQITDEEAEKQAVIVAHMEDKSAA